MALARTGRAWLDVPYSDKDRAKALGARWDPATQRWYAPAPGLPAFARWTPRPEAPDDIPGEDRGFGAGLFVDLIPSTSWFTNVRSAVDPRDWERLRRMVYRRAGNRCEACGSHPHHPAGLFMEAHERFTYDTRTGVQTLRRLICLCTACHGTTHFGFTNLGGEAESEAALGHLQFVTGLNRARAERHVRDAFALWERRSAITWRVDLSIITALGITPWR
jgi:Domain of unknown function (DUF5710)